MCQPSPAMGEEEGLSLAPPWVRVGRGGRLSRPRPIMGEGGERWESVPAKMRHG